MSIESPDADVPPMIPAALVTPVILPVFADWLTIVLPELLIPMMPPALSASITPLLLAFVIAEF